MCHISKWPPVYAEQPTHLNPMSHDSHMELNGCDWKWPRVILKITTTTDIGVKVSYCCSDMPIWGANCQLNRTLSRYSRCWDIMQNTWFVVKILLVALATAFMGVKLPNLVFDIPISYIFNVYLHLFVVQITMILLQCTHQTGEFFAAILKISDVSL